MKNNLVFVKVDENFNVTLRHFRPETLPLDMKKKGYLVDNIEEVEEKEGFRKVLKLKKDGRNTHGHRLYYDFLPIETEVE